MTTITTQGEVDSDHKLRLAVECNLPAGPVDVVLMLRRSEPSGQSPPWAELWGLGREVWRGVDANRYVAELREDRGPGT